MTLPGTDEAAAPSMAFVSIIAEDIVALFDFYRLTFDLDEVERLRNDKFRGIDGRGCLIGITAPSAYESLAIGHLADARGTKHYLTFEVASDDEVLRRTQAAIDNGATLLHEPYETHYQSMQTVLTDPEGNVLRINHFR